MSDMTVNEAIEVLKKWSKVQSCCGDPDCVCGRYVDLHTALARLEGVVCVSREGAAKVVEATFPPTHTHASENSDRYSIQDEAIMLAVARIRAMPGGKKESDDEGKP